jgi:hypothetical protein
MSDEDFFDPPDEIQAGELSLEGERADDAGNPRSVRRRKVKKELQEREADRFWRERVFNDEIGRREMWAILREAHTFEERFACGPNGFPQVEATWFEAGKQSLGQRIYQTWLLRYPELVMAMHRENDPRFAQTEKEK